MSAAIVALGSMGCSGSGGSEGSDQGGGGYAAPSGTAAVARSGDSVGITWSDQSTGESGFRIERSTGAAAFVQAGTAPPDAASFDDAGLAPGTLYSYRVKAYGPDGESAYSETASAATPATPAAPALAPVLTSPGGSDTALAVSWTSSSGEQGYRLERQRRYWNGSAWVYTPWALIRTFGASTTGVYFPDWAVSPSTTYQYRVLAYNLGGDSAWSNTVSAATTAAGSGPVSPTALAVQKQSSTSALFTWQIPTIYNRIEDLIIDLAGSNGWSQTVQMLGDGTSLTLIDLQPGVTYTISIRGHNQYGGGSTSAAVTATVAGPPAAPSPPQLLRAYPVADNRRVLSDLLVSQNNAVFSSGELIVGCNWFFDTFQWIQNSICYSSAIRFDVSALAGKTITQAQLWLKPSYPSPSPDTNFSVSAIASGWSASTLTGLTDLQLYTTGQWMVGAPGSFSSIGFDVTQIVQNWASGTWSNSGFLLQDVNWVFPYNTMFRAASFYSSDYYFSAVDDPPQLWVEYQ